jgi:hypothetical protein
LSADDQSWLAGFNRAENRLGVADQLSALPWLCWLPDDLGACPATALDRLATALAISPESAAGLLSAYGGWQGRTRREHRAQVLARLGRRSREDGGRAFVKGHVAWPDGGAGHRH